MSEIKIKLTVAGGNIEQGNGNAASDAQPKSKYSQDTAQMAFAVSKAMDVGKQLGRQIINNSVASIGLRTGNYVLQEQLQTNISIAKKTIGVATAFIANPFLGALALVGEGVDMAYQIRNRNIQLMWQNRQAAELRRRAGYLSSDRG